MCLLKTCLEKCNPTSLHSREPSVSNIPEQKNVFWGHDGSASNASPWRSIRRLSWPSGALEAQHKTFCSKGLIGRHSSQGRLLFGLVWLRGSPNVTSPTMCALFLAEVAPRAPVYFRVSQLSEEQNQF